MPTPAPVTTLTLSQFGQMIGQDVQAVASVAMSAKTDTATVRSGLSAVITELAGIKIDASTDKSFLTDLIGQIKTEAAATEASFHTRVDAKIAEVVGAAPAALNTLEELGILLTASGSGAEAIAAQIVDVSTKVTALEAAATQASTDIGLLFDTYLDSSGRVGATTGIVYKNPIVCLTSEAAFSDAKIAIDNQKFELNNTSFTVNGHPTTIANEEDRLNAVAQIQTKNDLLTKTMFGYSLPLADGGRFYIDPADTLQARLDAMTDADIATMIEAYRTGHFVAANADLAAIKALPEYKAALASITAAEAKMTADIAAMRAAQAL